jgi:hypothetical protein
MNMKKWMAILLAVTGLTCVAVAKNGGGDSSGGGGGSEVEVEDISLFGKIVQIDVAGGSSSGWGLQLFKIANGGVKPGAVVELALSPGVTIPAKARLVKVEGYYQTVTSIDRGTYTVFVVLKIERPFGR